MERDWPGNVRELENVDRARRSCSPTGDLIDRRRHPHQEAEGDPATAGLPRFAFRVGHSRWPSFEREAILRTLKAVGGDKDAAARILGIGVATLYRRLKDMEEGAKDARPRALQGAARRGGTSQTALAHFGIRVDLCLA